MAPTTAPALAPGRAKLEFRGVGKTFRTKGGVVEAVHDVSFGVHPNEFVSLVGASGCGKSTLLRIAAGLEPASAGEVRLNGEPIRGPGPSRAMVFQEYSLFPWLTVRENVLFSQRLAAHDDLSLEAGEALQVVERGDALIELMGLAAARDAYPKQLSGGMRQRAAIARALLQRPDVLLMDEPFGALDAQTREVMHDLILHLFQVERCTILFVTHDVEEAIYLADRVIVLAPRPGRIEEVLQVPLPAERTPEDKLRPEFLEMKRDTLHCIRRTAGMETNLDLLKRLTRSENPAS